MAPTNESLKAAYELLKKYRDRTDLKLKPLKHLKNTFTDFNGEEKPLNVRYYQVLGIMHLVVMKRFLLGDDTGLGKTLMSIGALCYLWEQDPNQKAVILTTKSASNQWLREFSKFSQGVQVILCRGTPKQRRKARKMFEEATGPTVIIMGYRSAVQDIRWIQSWKDFVLIADEATVFKNPKTQVHQVCRHLSMQADRVWALTATLIKNNLMEGFGILQGVVLPGLFQIGGKLMSKNQFMYYFCLVRMQPIPHSHRQIPIIIGYTDEKIVEFRKIIDPIFLGRPKHAVTTELPAVAMDMREVVLTPQQSEKYDEALTGLLSVGEGSKTEERGTTKLTALIYHQEIVNHLGLIGIDGASPKLDSLVDLLKEGDFSDEKVIVFSRFRRFIDIIMTRLKKERIPAVRVTGAEKDADRDAAMEGFQDPQSNIRVVCVTSAGTESINLQAAKAIICTDTPWSAGDFLQLIGRMIRIGSLHDRCYVIHMLARNSNGDETIDHKVMDVLNTKMHLIEGVLGKRLKGVDDDVGDVAVRNEISGIFGGLKQQAQQRKEND